MALDLKSSVNRKKNKTRSETLLVKGNKVEVTSDEEGFKRASYVAKIVKTSSKTQKGMVLVEYESLLADDEKTPLKEYFDASMIRTLPADTKKLKSLEVFDVVDVFFKDGWWKGVISEVHNFGGEDKKKTMRYTVVFDNPTDKIEIGSSSLRPHFDWSGGSWVKPKKQKRMKGLNFSKGMVVVVNIDEASLRNDWFEAAVLDEVGFNSFLVQKLGNSEHESGFMKLTVDSFHIRPPLPNLESENFELLDKVYVFYCSGWRVGFINKILTEGRFNVKVKHLNVEREFCHSEIRPSMDFINGSWVHYRKGALFLDAMNDAYSLEQPSFAFNAKSLEIAAQLESSSAAKDDSNEKTPCTNSEKNPMEEPTLSLPCKKSGVDTYANRLFSPECCAKLIPVEKPNQGAEVSITSQKEQSTHHVAYNQPITEYESLSRQKNEEPNQQENVVENEMMISAEERGTQPSSQVASQLVLTAAVLMQETNQTETGVAEKTLVSVEEGAVSPHSQAKSQLVQIVDALVEETNQQETAFEDETMISVEEQQMPPCSQVEAQLVQIAGVKKLEAYQHGTGIEDETMVSAEDGGMQPHVQVTAQLDVTAGEEDNAA
ncbi:unnamed protein product [Dovyalis caffra]|uniref:Agenet domain-containing protein n=1 Tax=Dovyalis caffra TaxID=77055 RepID=A0AAV1QRB6_9ROSI|nr:unnamed protein product [Dovyalis caffra]